MDQVRIFPCPNVELKLHLTEQMISDWRRCMIDECDQIMKTNELPVGALKCKNCSWNKLKVEGLSLCAEDHVVKKMKEVVKNGEKHE